MVRGREGAGLGELGQGQHLGDIGRRQPGESRGDGRRSVKDHLVHLSAKDHGPTGRQGGWGVEKQGGGVSREYFRERLVFGLDLPAMAPNGATSPGNRRERRLACAR